MARLARQRWLTRVLRRGAITYDKPYYEHYFSSQLLPSLGGLALGSVLYYHASIAIDCMIFTPSVRNEPAPGGLLNGGLNSWSWWSHLGVDPNYLKVLMKLSIYLSESQIKIRVLFRSKFAILVYKLLVSRTYGLVGCPHTSKILFGPLGSSQVPYRVPRFNRLPYWPSSKLCPQHTPTKSHRAGSSSHRVYPERVVPPVHLVSTNSTIFYGSLEMIHRGERRRWTRKQPKFALAGFFSEKKPRPHLCSADFSSPHRAVCSCAK